MHYDPGVDHTKPTYLITVSNEREEQNKLEWNRIEQNGIAVLMHSKGSILLNIQINYICVCICKIYFYQFFNRYIMYKQ